jgi:rhombotail lipoprotein
MTRRNRTRCRLALLALTTLSLTGCVGWDGTWRQGHASTPLVKFLYGQDDVPPHDASVELRLPIRVGLSFVPAAHPRSGSPPTAAQRSQVLQAIREKFRGLPYVAEIVIIPDYYLDPRRDNGMSQLQQLARLHRLDLYALASYDIVSANEMNNRAFAYLTIVGQFFVPGDTHTTQSLIDLAIIEPHSRQLVLRAGGASRLKGRSSVADLERRQNLQLQKGFQMASDELLRNFATELSDFEQRVRGGTAPIAVRRTAGGGGALDPWLLLALVCGVFAVSSRGVRASRRT